MALRWLGRGAVQRLALAAGESIHPESSYKDELRHCGLAAGAEFVMEQVWTDRGCLFSVHCLRVLGPKGAPRPG